jgi:hypothetical protein
LRYRDSRCVCITRNKISLLRQNRFTSERTVTGQFRIPSIALHSRHFIVPLRTEFTSASKVVRPAIVADSGVRIVWPSWIMRRQNLTRATSSLEPLLTYSRHTSCSKQTTEQDSSLPLKSDQHVLITKKTRIPAIASDTQTLQEEKRASVARTISKLEMDAAH